MWKLLFLLLIRDTHHFGIKDAAKEIVTELVKVGITTVAETAIEKILEEKFLLSNYKSYLSAYNDILIK